jgi:hypothetical protein
MTSYYLALATGDDNSRWVFMFLTLAQANKFVRDATECKLPEHPAYVGLQWDIVTIMPQLGKQALGEFLVIDDLQETGPV